jgi:hypothetical protein
MDKRNPLEEMHEPGGQEMKKNIISNEYQRDTPT